MSLDKGFRYDKRLPTVFDESDTRNHQVKRIPSWKPVSGPGVLGRGDLEEDT